MTRASFRLFRTGLVGSIVVALAAGGHVAGGGVLPPPAILAAVCALAVVPVAALTRRRLTFPVLVGLLGLGQAWLHWTFTALGAHASPAGSPGAGAGHGSHWAGGLIPAMSGSGLPDEALGGDFLAAGWGMLAAHCIATLVTAFLLARGEDALWLLAAWLRPLIRLPRPFVVLPVATRPAWFGTRKLVPPAAPALRLPGRRGPPRVYSAV